MRYRENSYSDRVCHVLMFIFMYIALSAFNLAQIQHAIWSHNDEGSLFVGLSNLISLALIVLTIPNKVMEVVRLIGQAIREDNELGIEAPKEDDNELGIADPETEVVAPG
jgi:hypothetical protein